MFPMFRYLNGFNALFFGRGVLLCENPLVKECRKLCLLKFVRVIVQCKPYVVHTKVQKEMQQ